MWWPSGRRPTVGGSSSSVGWDMATVGTPPVGGTPSASPWARSPGEIDAMYALVAGQMARIAARPGRTVDQLSPAEHHALGVRAAARWTTGASPAAPLTDDELPPDVDSALTVLSLAEYLMTSDDVPEQAVALAAGVRAWLVWLVGAEDRVALRELD